MRYRVGQVLFVILNKKGQVFPMLVIEEIVKRTLKGEEINYVLQGGSDPTSTVLLNKVDGDIFESAEEAKSTLISRATFQIDRLVSSAVEKASEWYSKSFVQENVVHELNQEESSQTVKLPDGTIARIKMSEVM